MVFWSAFIDMSSHIFSDVSLRVAGMKKKILKARKTMTRQRAFTSSRKNTISAPARINHKRKGVSMSIMPIVVVSESQQDNDPDGEHRNAHGERRNSRDS
jgi:hypothetical protein